MDQRYRPLEDGNLYYRDSANTGKVGYNIELDKLLLMNVGERIKYGKEMKKFYKIFEYKEDDWNGEKIQELIEDILLWLDENENEVNVVSYFRKHLFHPGIINELCANALFNKFYHEINIYHENIVSGKALKGDFNSNFASSYLKHKHNWVDQEQNKLLGQPTITINLPSFEESKILPPRNTDALFIHDVVEPSSKILPPESTETPIESINSVDETTIIGDDVDRSSIKTEGEKKIPF